MIVRVVSGLAVHNGAILMGKRRPDKLRGDLWELPGGKVEPGESAPEALAREWMEGLGISIEVGPLIAVAVFDLDHTYAIELYEVRASRVALENVHSLDHAALAWHVPREAMLRMPCVPAFYLHYPQIRRWLNMMYGGTISV